MSATERQVGGDHYRRFEIQPIEFLSKNDVPFPEGSVVKYVLRHRAKGGVDDINKAIHILELIKEIEYGEGDV